MPCDKPLSFADRHCGTVGGCAAVVVRTCGAHRPVACHRHGRAFVQRDSNRRDVCGIPAHECARVRGLCSASVYLVLGGSGDADISAHVTASPPPIALPCDEEHHSWLLVTELFISQSPRFATTLRWTRERREHAQLADVVNGSPVAPPSTLSHRGSELPRIPDAGAFLTKSALSKVWLR